ncbi:MAG: replication initiation protein [Arcobacteraceae bacterium]|nr:replication initiation protein [Arcobacteraceae bacterium]
MNDTSQELITSPAPEKSHIKKKIHIIQKESALTAIYASGNLTASQKKVFNAFLYLGKDMVQSEMFAPEEGFVVPVSMLKNLIGDQSNNYTYLKKTVESLQDFTVESNVLGKDKKKWDRFSLVAGATIENGTLRFSFPHQIIDALKNPKMYVTLDLDEINRIDRKYAISLYEIIEDYKKLPALPKWSIDEFRKALDIPDSSYKTYRDLHRRVVEPAVEEINDKFGMGLEYVLYSNLLAIPSGDLNGSTENSVMAKRARMPRITHIQFRLVKEKMQERLSYKSFVEEMRAKYMPNPTQGHFPAIDNIDGKVFKVDTTGRLYIQHVSINGTIEIEELSPEKSDTYWKMLWKNSLIKLTQENLDE